MIPSKSPYSSGWSSTWTARRLSAGFRDGPLGTAHERSTPSISSRRSQCIRRAPCLWTTKRPPASVSFNWLHKTDGSRLKQQYFCPKDGEVVDKEGMIKGYEFSKGQYVKFTAEELKALDERGTGAIDVKEFLPAEQVDRIFLEKTYFLGPDKGGERAYRLLAEALKKTGRVVIGQYAARGKGYLIMIRPIGGRLAMEQLRYADELRSIDEVPVGEVDVKPAELELAVQFIEQAATDQLRPEASQDKG